MSNHTVARQPAGAPASAGGEFATMGRTEPTLTLAAGDQPSLGERDDDASLSERIRAAHNAVTFAWRQVTRSAEAHQAAQVRWWEQSAHRAEEDLGDLRLLRAGTVPGLAALPDEFEA